MIISREKRKENIAEYLLYMWQIEDLIRGCELDLDKIKNSVIDKYTLPDEEKKKMEEWYADLIDMMRTEGCTEKGHLQINKNVILNLTDLHASLLASVRYPFYNAAYFKALPFIVELRQKNGKKDEPELETCFEALYGVLFLKLQKKEISPETAKAMEAISSFISLLASYYDKERKGELKLDD